MNAPTDRSRSDCIHEQVAKRIANVRFTRGEYYVRINNRATSVVLCIQIKQKGLREKIQ